MKLNGEGDGPASSRCTALLKTQGRPFQVGDTALLLLDGMERPLEAGHPAGEVSLLAEELLSLGSQLLLSPGIFDNRPGWTPNAVAGR